MSEAKLRRAVIDIALEMNRSGLNQGTSGNISIRCKEGFLVTPSALQYEQCQPDDIVQVTMSGEPSGRRKPSSEWRMHRDIYKRFPEAEAVLHAHPVWCTTLACLEKPIPPFHYMVAMAGGTSIPCAPYALFGSQELSDGMLGAMEDCRACLLAHHGMICYTTDPAKLLSLAIEIETLAKIYVQTLQIAPPPLLSAQQMEQVVTQFRDYKP